MGSATMSRMRMRGFSDENGSWKTICIWRRNELSIFLSSSCVTLTLLKCTEPELVWYRPAIRRAMVDLPDPDSPTRPNTSPSLMEKLTSLTASSVSSEERRVGKEFVSTFRSRVVPLHYKKKKQKPTTLH